MFAWIKIPHVMHCSLFHLYSALFFNIHWALIQYLFRKFCFNYSITWFKIATTSCPWDNASFLSLFFIIIIFWIQVVMHIFCLSSEFLEWANTANSSSWERSSFTVDSAAEQPQWLCHCTTNHWGLRLHSLTFWHYCCAEWKLSTRPTLSLSGAPLSSFPADWGRCSVRLSTTVKHVSCLWAKESQLGAKESKWQLRCVSTLQWGLFFDSSESCGLIHMCFRSSGGLYF